MQDSRFRRIPRAVALLAMGFALSPPPAQGREWPGLRFDSPGVLNLSAREFAPAAMQSTALAAESLERAAGLAILDAPTLGEDEPLMPFAEGLARCKTPSDACVRAYEKSLLAQDGPAVERAGPNLSIAASAGSPARFADSRRPATRKADGDGASHTYLGRMAGNGYRRVEVRFMHDAPGSFLIAPENGKTAFVHNGGDIAALSPDGSRLLVFNTLNPPVSIKLAKLDGDGPKIELQCDARREDTPAYPAFKGWRGSDGVDIVLNPSMRARRTDEGLPLRLSRTGGEWRLATADPERLRTFGLVCRQPKAP